MLFAVDYGAAVLLLLDPQVLTCVHLLTESVKCQKKIGKWLGFRMVVCTCSALTVRCFFCGLLPQACWVVVASGPCLAQQQCCACWVTCCHGILLRAGVLCMAAACTAAGQCR